MDERRRHGLGRGLNALFGDAGGGFEAEEGQRQPHSLPVEQLRPGLYQPRRVFDEDAIAALADSIRERGVLQPILVRPHPSIAGAYEIIAGERRWRASQRAKLHEVPVVVRAMADREALEIALIENIQRQDLTPLEEAEGYRRLIEEFSHTQEALARALGRSRSHIANMLRLLGLPDPVKAMIQDGALTAGHARALLSLPDPVSAADEVVRRGLNVRQTERLGRPAPRRAEAGGGPGGASAGVSDKDADTLALERDLSNRLGLQVSISQRGPGGTLALHYQSLDQLDELLRRLV